MKSFDALINIIYQLLYFIIAFIFINPECHVRFVRVHLLIFLKYAVIKIGMGIRDAAHQIRIAWNA